MLISRAKPILQVTHSRGGQYKYSGHTIFLPPRIFQYCHIPTPFYTYLDILVVRKCNSTNNPYELFVSRTHVLTALEYKKENDPYFKDVQVNLVA